MSSFDVKGFYAYSGFDEPKLLATNLDEFLIDVVFESNFLGDETEQVRHHIEELFSWYEHNDLEVFANDEMSKDLEKDMKDLLYGFGVFVNPTYEELQSFNLTHGLDKEEYLHNVFEKNTLNKNNQMDLEL